MIRRVVAWCSRIIICIHNSGVITGAYCGVLKIGEDVVVVVHDESSFSCSGDAEFHGFWLMMVVQ